MNLKSPSRQQTFNFSSIHLHLTINDTKKVLYIRLGKVSYDGKKM